MGSNLAHTPGHEGYTGLSAGSSSIPLGQVTWVLAPSSPCLLVPLAACLVTVDHLGRKVEKLGRVW